MPHLPAAPPWVTFSSLSCSLVSRGPLSHPPCVGHHSQRGPQALAKALPCCSTAQPGLPQEMALQVLHRDCASERKGKPCSASHQSQLWVSGGAHSCNCSCTEHLGMEAGPAGSSRGGLRMEKALLAAAQLQENNLL